MGTGHSHMLGVALQTEGDDAESAILQAPRTLIKALPAGTALHKICPDLVSLAEVAETLEVERQTFQQCKMLLPVAGGLHRID